MVYICIYIDDCKWRCPGISWDITNQLFCEVDLKRAGSTSSMAIEILNNHDQTRLSGSSIGNSRIIGNLLGPADLRDT